MVLSGVTLSCSLKCIFNAWWHHGFSKRVAFFHPLWTPYTSIRFQSDSVKRPSPARQQQKSLSIAHKHLLAFDAARKWKTTLGSTRGEWVLEAWFWRNTRWLFFSYRSSCVVLSSQCVVAARVCRVIRKMNIATLLSVSILHFFKFLETSQQPCCAALHAWRTPFKSTTSFHRSMLIDCSDVVFWHSCPLVPNYQRSTRFYRKKQLFVRVHFTMKPEMNETLREQLCWNVQRCEGVIKIT